MLQLRRREYYLLHFLCAGSFGSSHMTCPFTVFVSPCLCMTFLRVSHFVLGGFCIFFVMSFLGSCMGSSASSNDSIGSFSCFVLVLRVGGGCGTAVVFLCITAAVPGRKAEGGLLTSWGSWPGRRYGDCWYPAMGFVWLLYVFL